MFIALEELAEVNLGYKSLQNDFFYLNAESIETYGIENRFLLPIYKLRNLKAASYLQDIEPTLWLFHCQAKLHDLRGTGALRYIESMADRAATEKKQTGKRLTIREALEAQSGGLWYAPKAKPHKRNIWIRKAFDGVFAPFLFEKPVLVDQRVNSVTVRDNESSSWEEMAALLTLTAFAYSVEINGSSSMGAGVLEAPTTKIRGYPVLDIRVLKKAERTKLVSLARVVWSSEPPVDWSNERLKVGKKLEALDRWVFERVNTKVTVERLYRDMHEACLARVGLAKDKVKKTIKKKTENIGNVAESIAASIAPLIKGKNFPENFIDGELDLDISITQELVRNINIQHMLGEMDVLISDESGNTLLEATYPESVAESIVRAILWGRSTFQLTLDQKLMNNALVEFIRWTLEIDREISNAIAGSALGTGYEDQLKSKVFERLGVHPAVFEKRLAPSISLKKL